MNDTTKKDWEGMTKAQQFEHAMFLLNRCIEIIQDVEASLSAKEAEVERLGHMGLDYAQASYDCCLINIGAVVIWAWQLVVCEIQEGSIPFSAAKFGAVA